MKDVMPMPNVPNPYKSAAPKSPEVRKPTSFVEKITRTAKNAAAMLAAVVAIEAAAGAVSPTEAQAQEAPRTEQINEEEKSVVDQAFDRLCDFIRSVNPGVTQDKLDRAIETTKAEFAKKGITDPSEQVAWIDNRLSILEAERNKQKLNVSSEYFSGVFTITNYPDGPEVEFNGNLYPISSIQPGFANSPIAKKYLRSGWQQTLGKRFQSEPGLNMSEAKHAFDMRLSQLLAYDAAIATAEESNNLSAVEAIRQERESKAQAFEDNYGDVLK